ncbi:MAG TPA: GNAT family N-acetyltransferase [Paucimonas sp.]|nr:GNAT family N-acetyltransferase [Paucimonas sp.]
MHDIRNFSLEAVAESDFEQLLALRIEAMRESLERIGRFDPDRARERFRGSFSPQHTRRIAVAGKHVGFVAVRPVDGDLLLDHLYIRPGFQGRGIGTAVLERIFEEADERGLPIRVGALKGSDSNRFYARHGFRKVAEEEWDIRYVRDCER